MKLGTLPIFLLALACSMCQTGAHLFGYASWCRGHASCHPAGEPACGCFVVNELFITALEEQRDRVLRNMGSVRSFRHIYRPAGKQKKAGKG